MTVESGLSSAESQAESMVTAMSFALRLDASNQLLWEGVEEAIFAEPYNSLQEHFDLDWRAGLFYLAAEKYAVGHLSTVLYWQIFAEYYLTQLCQLSRSHELQELTFPPIELFAYFADSIPPEMQGEGPTVEQLRSVWSALESWVDLQLEDFLGDWEEKEEEGDLTISNSNLST